jgi:hypothetical protein
MAIGRRARDTETDPFYDMVFNLLIAFVFCFIVALLAFNPQAKKAGDVPAKAEFMITVSWPDGNPNDVDTWMRDPAGKLLWFRQRDAGMMHLDRDDRGAQNNSVVVDGQLIVNNVRQEIATLRGIVPGQYVVNAHYYDSKDKAPVDVSVTVVKINPQAQLVFSGAQRLTAKGDERTLIRFSLDAAGGVTSLDSTQITLVQRSGL